MFDTRIRKGRTEKRMAICWYFYRFDYAAYTVFRPALRSATTPAAFATLADCPDTLEIVEELLHRDITVETAKHKFVLAKCLLGDPMPIDTSFARFVAGLARRKGFEDAADVLSELIEGGKNRETWLAGDSGISGYLKPEELVLLECLHDGVPKRNRLGATGSPERRRAAQRGGILGAGANFARQLIVPLSAEDDMLIELCELLNASNAHHDGIIVISADAFR